MTTHTETTTGPLIAVLQYYNAMYLSVALLNSKCLYVIQGHGHSHGHSHEDHHGHSHGVGECTKPQTI